MMKLSASATYRELIERDRRTVTPAVYRYTPLAFARGEGAYLYDIEGNRYLDFAAGMATLPLGHCHPRVVAAIKDQADKIHHVFNHLGYYPPYVELIEQLQGLMPAELQDGMALLMNSGSEAVESALKAARYVTGRPAIISFMYAFHGRSLGALSVTASKAGYRSRHSGLLPGVYYAPYPHGYRFLGRRLGDAEALEMSQAFIGELLANIVPPEDVAAILVEPIQGEGGYRVPPAGFLPYLRQVADDIGCLLIVDEIQTGFGRTGKMFGFEHSGIVPDLISMAKAFGGGLPLSGVFGKKAVMEKWGAGAQGSTFGGNPLAIAAAKATLEVIVEEDLPANAARVGAVIMERLQAAAAGKSCIGDVRGKGLMLGMELVDGDGNPAADLAKKVVVEAAARGLVITTCGSSTIRFAPPLNLTEEQAAAGVEIVLSVLSHLGY